MLAPLPLKEGGQDRAGPSRHALRGRASLSSFTSSRSAGSDWPLVGAPGLSNCRGSAVSVVLLRRTAEGASTLFGAAHRPAPPLAPSGSKEQISTNMPMRRLSATMRLKALDTSVGTALWLPASKKSIPPSPKPPPVAVLLLLASRRVLARPRYWGAATAQDKPRAAATQSRNLPDCRGKRLAEARASAAAGRCMGHRQGRASPATPRGHSAV